MRICFAHDKKTACGMIEVFQCLSLYPLYVLAICSSTEYHEYHLLLVQSMHPSSLPQLKSVMLKNMEDLMQRGETLESLEDKSADLSMMGKKFAREARKNNECCST